jgi:hypothetical protein
MPGSDRIVQLTSWSNGADSGIDTLVFRAAFVGEAKTTGGEAQNLSPSSLLWFWRVSYGTE